MQIDGSIVFQLFSFLILFMIPVVIVYFIRVSRRKKQQLDSIEEKLNKVLNDTNK
ncbi:hypothetical protein [Chengkuizengella sediminis]|uniref:hypothetical protein n=1 Tax=Chengkuizengella sediminis TaxID=1885917 RepID=UPI001389C90A|nr:hypothetical protein [Chengkuizengella sediminis]NDI35487.1 hypothetical protein [Chengkuizengella sediminis]